MAKLTGTGWVLIVDKNVDINDTGTNENGFGDGMGCTMTTGNFMPWSLADFDGKLLAGINSLGGARVLYSTNGGSGDSDWSYSVGGGVDTELPVGFDGLLNTPMTNFYKADVYQNIAVNLFPFEGYLYAGLVTTFVPEYGATEAYLTGSHIWKSSDGTETSWEQITGNGFRDAHIVMFEAFTNFNSTLYVSGSKGASSTPTGIAGAKVFRLASGPLDDYDLDGKANNIDNCPLIPNSLQEDTGDSDGVGDACDNCPEIPNGPNGGTCICGGSSCMSDGACDYGSCNMNQEDTNNDRVGDVCDQSLCRGYLCRYEYCSELQNAGRNVDYSACRALTNQGEEVCEEAECYWNPYVLPSPGACVVDICQSNANFDSAVDGKDLAVYKKELFRVDCPYYAGGNLCEKYFYLYNYCVDSYRGGRNVDYNACKALTNQGESVCEAAGCYWNPYVLPSPGACVIDICQSNANFDGAVDGQDLAVYKKELFRVDCPK